MKEFKIGTEKEDAGKFVFFWKLHHSNEEFSNWYPKEFVIEGIRYNCVEQYMMAKKAILFGDITVYQQIMSESDPGKCKELGKLVRNFDSATWDSCKREIVFNANYAKFTQNPDLMAKLKATGNAIIAEASPGDKIWGIGMAADDPAARCPNRWAGQNLLGGILQEIRDSEESLKGNRIEADCDIIVSALKERAQWAISQIKSIEKIEWGGGPTGEKTDDGRDVIQMPYPKYPSNLFEILNILGTDTEFTETINDVQKMDPGDMNLHQIRTFLTGMIQGERFCDGLIAGYIEDGTLLTCIERIEAIIE